MMEESAAACVKGNFAQALEKGKEAVSQSSQLMLCSPSDNAQHELQRR